MYMHVHACTCMCTSMHTHVSERRHMGACTCTCMCKHVDNRAVWVLHHILGSNPNLSEAQIGIRPQKRCNTHSALAQPHSDLDYWLPDWGEPSIFNIKSEIRSNKLLWNLISLHLNSIIDLNIHSHIVTLWPCYTKIALTLTIFLLILEVDRVISMWV